MIYFFMGLRSCEIFGKIQHRDGYDQVPDQARCKFLAATFKEITQQWFQKFGPGEIVSWDQMKNLFSTKFQAAMKYALPVTSLTNIKQKEGKSLTSYFKRFNAKSTMVRGATDEMRRLRVY